MLRRDSALNTFIIAAMLAVAVAYFVPRLLTQRALSIAPNNGAAQASSSSQAAPASTPTAATAALPAATWAAAAPGRVEPNGGEVRITAQAGGRIAEVLVAVNDKVAAGDLMVRIDDQELEARVAAAEAEANVRRRDRDGETINNALARERRTAEDAVATAERQFAQYRADFDRTLRARRAGTASQADVEKAREAVSATQQRLDTVRTNLRRIALNEAMPLQTRLEAGIAAARADLSMADAALERTRVRATRDATVLQVLATPGETASPSLENVLVILGDMSKIRVRAEIEERDVGKVRAGQVAVVRSDAFPNREFTGRIATLSQSLGPARLSLKGPRKPTDLDVLEVMIDLEGTPPLLSGMRVDVFLKPDATATNAAAPTKSN
jgi:HlyD family secretion protein